MQKESFGEFRTSIEGLRNSPCGYTSYLLSKSNQRLQHALKEPTDNSVTTLAHTIALLHDIMKCLELKDQGFEVYEEDEIVFLGNSLVP